MSNIERAVDAFRSLASALSGDKLPEEPHDTYTDEEVGSAFETGYEIATEERDNAFVNALADLAEAADIDGPLYVELLHRRTP